jgi:hypothetical protein
LALHCPTYNSLSRENFRSATRFLPPRAYLTHFLLVMDHHHLTPSPQPQSQPSSPHRKTSLPTFAKSIPVEIAALSASTRTSFTRVDNTRPSTSADLRDEIMTAPLADSDGAHEPPPPSNNEQPEEAGPPMPSVPQVPQTLVQFLLVSGRRRSMAFEPETTVGRVKELVWNTWPNGTFNYYRVYTHAL